MIMKLKKQRPGPKGAVEPVKKKIPNGMNRLAVALHNINLLKEGTAT
jgi:hypothetical protein